MYEREARLWEEVRIELWVAQTKLIDIMVMSKLVLTEYQVNVTIA